VRLNVGNQMHSKESRRFVGLPLPVATCLFHSAPRKHIEIGQLDNMQDNYALVGQNGKLDTQPSNHIPFLLQSVHPKHDT